MHVIRTRRPPWQPRVPIRTTGGRRGSWSSRPTPTTPNSARPGRRPAGSRPVPRAGWCAAPAATRVARTRTPTRSSSRRCARRSSGRRPPSSGTRACPSSISPTERWRTTSRYASCWSARSGPSAPTRCSRPIPKPSSTATAGSTTRTTGRPGSRRSTRCIQRRATRWRSRGSRATGSPRTGSGACTCSGRTSRRSGSTSRRRSICKIAALAAHASQIHDAAGLAERIRAWAAEEGAADRRGRGRGPPRGGHRRRRGRRTRVTTVRCRRDGVRRPRAAAGGSDPSRSTGRRDHPRGDRGARSGRTG